MPPRSRGAQPSLDEIARDKLEALERRQLRRRLIVTARPSATAARQSAAELVSFSCNDYLGLSQHPEVVAAGIDATHRFGVGAGSSRLVNGNHPLYLELESKLAALKGTEDCVVFGSGYLTNVGVIPALLGRSDLVLLDELSHSSLLTGAALSGARVLEFRHNDVGHAAELLTAERSGHRHCLVLTDGVFSMEGDLAPLPALATLAAEHDAWLMTDDAHGLGVVGDGRGSSFATDINNAGTVVGTLLHGEERLSWVWRNGQMTIHRGGKGLHLTNSINDQALVIGATYDRRLIAATMSANAVPVPPPQGGAKFTQAALLVLVLAVIAVWFRRRYHPVHLPS